jgi:poly-gamma-glutamate synthesis protein (capsule biosynthesis protein)
MALLRNILNIVVWVLSVWLLSIFLNSSCWKEHSYIIIPPPPEYIDVTIVAVGDLISHQDVQKAALDAENGWASLWEEITPTFKEADLAMVNLETPIAPKTGKPGIPFCFNAPADLASALKETGIDLVFTANNHAYDQQAKGVAETLEHLGANNIKQAGAGLDRVEALAPVTIELRGGIKVAVLARTDLFNNNLNNRHDHPWVAELDLDRDALIIEEIRPNVDTVIFSAHWGNEYHITPSLRQREAAKRLIAAGADIIVGHHPHVLQPFEWIESGGRRGAVAFSLGNFLSNQDRMYSHTAQPLSSGDSRDGGLMVITLRKDTSGIFLHDVHVEPVWTDNNWSEYTHGQAAKRAVHVLRTVPGDRGAEMEQLLSQRRAHALARLGSF